MTKDVSVSEADDLAAMITKQRRRIRNRLTGKDDARWPLDKEDRTELGAIDELLVSVEAALALRSSPVEQEPKPVFEARWRASDMGEYAELIAELRSSHLHMYDGTKDGHGMKVFRLCDEAAAALASLVEREKMLTDLAERLKMEAQYHASEARTANATIYEIYQVVSGGKGEPGNWHGAEPVRERFGTLTEALKPFAEAADSIDGNDPGHWHMWEHPASMNVNVNNFRDARKALRSHP